MSKRIILFISISIMVLMVAGCNLLPTLKPVDRGTTLDKLPVKDSLLAKHIPTQVIVKTTDQAVLTKIVKDFNGKITGEIKGLHVYKINVDVAKKGSLVETIKAIRSYGKVQYAEPVYIYEATGITDSDFATRQWGPKSIGLEDALDIAMKQGDGVIIAIADTGVDYTHQEFDTRVLPGYDTFYGNTGVDATMDYHGHGTHVAGIAAANIHSGKMVGIAPKSLILPVKVLDDSGSGSDYTIASGICWAVDNGAKVINMSLGGKGYSQAMQDAVDYALSKNVSVVVAMANTGKNEVMYPAACSGVIAVGATDGNMKVASFSTRGRHISISAPGVDIFSSIPNAEYATWNGTSMATPHVAGAIALLLGEEPALNVTEIKSRLEASAIDTDLPGFDENTGYGVINLVNLLSTKVSDVYGSIKVYVELSGWPMSGIDVLVQDANNQTVKNIRTNDNGTAFINNLKAGTYTVKVNMGEQKYSKTVTVTAGGMAVVNFIEVVPTSLAGYVVNSRGGSGIDNTQITVIEETTGTTYSTFTGSDGSFYFELPAGVYQVIANKTDYASSSYQCVEVKKDRMKIINMIQKEAFSRIYSKTPPVITLNGLTKNAELANTVTFNVDVISPNAIKQIDIRFGHFGAMPDESILDTNTFEIVWDTTCKPNGSNFIDIIVYDMNNNITEWAVPVSINNNQLGYPLPERPELDSIVAMTFGENLGLFKAKRNEVFTKLNRKDNPYILKFKDQEFNIEAVPDNATIYVVFSWYSVAYADGYKVYRATTPFGPFAQIADVNKTKYIDCDPALTSGIRYYYKTVPYNSTGVGPASEVIETKPMEPFYVSLVSPAHNATNVSINPTLTWSYTPIVSDYLYFWLYIMGTTDSDYTRMMEVYDRSSSYAYIGESLVAGKEYEWDIYTSFAVRVYSDNSTAMSWSKQGNGSTNGAFTFTTDPNALPPTKESVLELDINSPNISLVDIPFNVTEEAYYEIATSYYYQECDTILTLYDANGNIIASNDDFGNTYSMVTVPLVPGQYKITISEYWWPYLYCHLSVNKIKY